MRRSSPFLVLLLAATALSGCGQSSNMSERSAESASPASDRMSNASADMAAPESQAEPRGGTAERTAAGPNVGVTAAPGVAFNYRYAFRLAAPRISEVQEQHAQMCERLTVVRCRITGMYYRVVNDRDIEAMLAFKLDPALARSFGREGVGAVVRAEGMLTESEITGTDAGTAIRQAGRGLAELEAELARIQARLAGRISTSERERLDYEAQAIRQQIAALRQNREAHQESLATTPMVFRYGSGDRVPGFAPRPTIGQSLERAWEGFVDGATMLLIILVTLLPWAVALGLIWLIVRYVRRRWFPNEPAAPAAEA